jgi:hypothetical protein
MTKVTLSTRILMKIIIKYCLFIVPFCTFASDLVNNLEHLQTSLTQLHKLLKPIKTEPAFQFIVTSCNMLYTPYYIQYSKPNNAVIDIKDRKKAFKQALKSNNGFYRADILCFQEWPYNPGTIFSKYENEIIFVNGKKLTKKSYLNSISTEYHDKFLKKIHKSLGSHYRFIADQTTYDGLLMYINTAKFDIISYEFKTILAHQKLLTTILRTKNESKILIGVITAHFPFIKNDVNQQALHMIQAEILNHPNVTYWIVCGDFNYDILDSTYHRYLNKNKFNRLTSFFPNFNNNVMLLAKSVNNDYLLPPTAFGAPGHFEFDDYVFFSNNFKNVYATIFPENPDTLLKHNGQDPQQKSYFSDHAIIRVEFEL